MPINGLQKNGNENRVATIFWRRSQSGETAISSPCISRTKLKREALEEAALIARQPLMRNAAFTYIAILAQNK